MTESAPNRILIVDDEEGIRFTLASLLTKEGYLVETAADHATAIAALQTARYDLAFVDIMLSGDNGIDVLHDIKTISPSTLVVMFTGRPDVKTAAEAVRLGAFDYITKPVQPKMLLSVCRSALNEKKMLDEREQHRANLDAIFRSVSDAIIMVDSQGRLAAFNETAGKVCGYTAGQIGSDAAAISLGCLGVCRSALMESIARNVRSEIRRFECRTPDGAHRIVSFTATPVSEADGTNSGAVAVIRDETPLVELERSLKRRSRFHGIIGISDPMQRIYALIEALAKVPATVLINGESGTGKELVAAALHHSGERAQQPFVKVNCSALSEALLESELFGHVRGAFTGAISDKTGRFQKAHRGTLFLDEIGDISPAVQMRLLRVLQESEFERVGESTSIKVDVRIIAATNHDLAGMVSRGAFRQDLYYRLNVVRIELPSLRERSEDIALLADHFMALFNTRFGKSIRGFSDDAMALFRSHPWPGNVRELEHAVEHAVILCKSDIIAVRDLPQDLIDSVQAVTPSSPPLPSSPPDKLSLAEALALCDGNKTRAARLLGVSRQTVYRHRKEPTE